jgi:hypothetical protein
MNWLIKSGEQSVIGVGGAIDIVVGRLEYIASQPRDAGSRCLVEAIQYARLLQAWVRENQPELRQKEQTGEYIGCRPGGKPGPMSDG